MLMKKLAWRRLHFKSIRDKIIFSIIAFMVIPTIMVMFASFRKTENIISNKVLELSINNMEQVNASFQQVIYSLVHASNIINMDNDLMRTLEDTGTNDDYAFYQRQRKILDKISSALAVDLRYNNIITVIENSGNIYKTWYTVSEDTTGTSFLSAEWYKKAKELNGNINWIIPQKDYTTPRVAEDNRSLISISRLIKGYMDGKAYGVLLISIPIEEIEKQLGKKVNSSREGFFIIDNNGDIVVKTEFAKQYGIQDLGWCKDKIMDANESVFTAYFNGRKMQVIVKDINNLQLDLRAAYIIPYDEMLAEVKDLEKDNFLILFTVMAIVIVILIQIAMNISKPLKNLIDQMQKIKEGNLDLNIHVDSFDEVGQLTDNFNLMLQDIKGLMNKVAFEERQKKDTYFMALQSQINPHFLFNTLNSIKWMAYMNGSDNVGHMIASLGSLYETVIRNDSEYITIEEEMQFITNYMKLIELRFNQGLDIELNVHEELYDFYTLKFILQPIVENSIIHGFEGCNYQKKIHITCIKDEGMLVFKVKDNGKGIPKEKVKTILNQSMNVNKGRFTSIGISNVNERIKLNFGDSFGIYIESKEGTGTIVSVKIPMMRDINEGAEMDNDKSNNRR